MISYNRHREIWVQIKTLSFTVCDPGQITIHLTPIPLPDNGDNNAPLTGFKYVKLSSAWHVEGALTNMSSLLFDRIMFMIIIRIWIEEGTRYISDCPFPQNSHWHSSVKAAQLYSAQGGLF